MRIITWNVNGLRAVFNKGSLEWILAQQADGICLQEIKARPAQLDPAHLGKFDSYQGYWNPAQRPGYSGVVTLLRQPAEEVQLELGAPHFDEEGRVVRTRQADFLLYNVYFPNGQRDQGRLDYKLDFYAHLLDDCDRLHAAGEHIVICGDFNTAHREIDLRHPRQNSTNSGFLPEERAWIDKYLEHGFVDAFRFFYPEKVQYTWWTYIGNARARNTGWRLDYYLISAGLMGRVKDVIIHDEVMGSDHCPVSLLID